MKNRRFVSIILFLLIIFATAFAVRLLYDAQKSENDTQEADALPAFATTEPPENTVIPSFSENGYKAELAFIREKSVSFDDSGVFAVSRFEFSENGEGAVFSRELLIEGRNIRVKRQNLDVSPAEWEIVTDLSNVPKATLFIETDDESMIVSVPAIYKDSFHHNTLEGLPDSEAAVAIEETQDGYAILANYDAKGGTVGELWYYKFGENSAGSAFDVSPDDFWLRQDLHKNRRFSLDGYYFKTYENYVPYSENGFFRNAANFTGAQILKDMPPPYKNIGYAMTKICMANQNSLGFWETGPQSAWLYNDYGISYGFYDTRFSTDFARSLLDGYAFYGDTEMLNSAELYADFVIGYADRWGYSPENGIDIMEKGVFLPDYWSGQTRVTPHVSLNHQLAVANFLLELFVATNKPQYELYAQKLLDAIESTVNDWILDDGNLRYAILYEETSNIMQDYPYLTYNDLLDTRALLEKTNQKQEFADAIDTLIASKKAWIDENGVTGYNE